MLLSRYQCALSPPWFHVRFVFLFSNCYLVLFDKEKGVVWLLACFFGTPPRHQPPTFLCYNVASSPALIITLIRSFAETRRPLLCVYLAFELICRGLREPRTLLDELFYIPAINVSAQTQEQGEHLLPLSSETRQTVQKGNVRLAKREECVSLWIDR